MRYAHCVSGIDWTYWSERLAYACVARCLLRGGSWPQFTGRASSQNSFRVFCGASNSWSSGWAIHKDEGRGFSRLFGHYKSFYSNTLNRCGPYNVAKQLASWTSVSTCLQAHQSMFMFMLLVGSQNNLQDYIRQQKSNVYIQPMVGINFVGHITM
jgi:hypothetical protein